MSWEIEFTREALRDISRLETKTVERVVDKLEESKKNPYHFFQRLVGNDYFKLRVGEYRVLAFLLNDNKIVVQKIGHRKGIYKNL